jgi:hypothetical protein
MPFRRAVSAPPTLPTPTPIPASTRVFLLPELLGSIISCLSKVDILTHAQRVSHTWQTAVASPEVQDKLWQLKGKRPAVMPMRIATLMADQSLHDIDISLPIYKIPLLFNGLFSRERCLYQQCLLTSDLRMMCRLNRPVRSNYSKRIICMESLTFTNYCCEGRGPIFSEDHTMPWRSMQICNPPITTAKLTTYSGSDKQALDTVEGFTTVYDKYGITMGLVHDTAAAALRTNTGEQNPRLGWRLYLEYGIQKGSEGAVTCGHDGFDCDGGYGEGKDLCVPYHVDGCQHGSGNRGFDNGRIQGEGSDGGEGGVEGNMDYESDDARFWQGCQQPTQTRRKSFH